jgi:hypothetical protein
MYAGLFRIQRLTAARTALIIAVGIPVALTAIDAADHAART